ncbi:MAG: NAD-dependent epimerase/dehydratase family protein [Burkholderiaceae bacterium]
MRILIVGGKGFIGRHIAKACADAGHTPLIAARAKHGADIACDLREDVDAEAWGSRLKQCDAVINCVGLLFGSAQDLQAVHCDAPAAVAAACKAAKKPFLHISVLGLEHAASTPYFTTKRDGESAILAANPAAIIVRPGAVFGLDSPATQLLLLQARLPLIVTPRHACEVAPVHVDDLAQLCAALIGTVRAAGAHVDCVGSETMSIAAYIQALRTALGLGQAKALSLPNAFMRAALALPTRLGARVMRTEVMDLMEHAHTGDARMFARWMRRPPRSVNTFLEREEHTARTA